MDSSGFGNDGRDGEGMLLLLKGNNAKDTVIVPESSEARGVKGVPAAVDTSGAVVLSGRSRVPLVQPFVEMLEVVSQVRVVECGVISDCEGGAKIRSLSGFLTTLSPGKLLNV